MIANGPYLYRHRPDSAPRVVEVIDGYVCAPGDDRELSLAKYPGTFTPLVEQRPAPIAVLPDFTPAPLVQREEDA